MYTHDNKAWHLKMILARGVGGGGTLKTQHHFLPVPEAQVKCELRILLQDYLTFKGVGTFDFFFCKKDWCNILFLPVILTFPMEAAWRQHGRVARAPDLKSRGCGFKSCSGHSAGAVSWQTPVELFGHTGLPPARWVF